MCGGPHNVEARPDTCPSMMRKLQSIMGILSVIFDFMRDWAALIGMNRGPRNVLYPVSINTSMGSKRVKKVAAYSPEITVLLSGFFFHSAVPDTVEALCTIIHLLLQKKSNLPSSFLISTMSDSWWDVWHMGHSQSVSICYKDNKTQQRNNVRNSAGSDVRLTIHCLVYL